MVEKAFEQKNIPNECKSEILLKLVEEKDVNFPVYINEEELEDYEKIKSLILKEYEHTPFACLESLRKTRLIIWKNSSIVHIWVKIKLDALSQNSCGHRF